MNPAAYFDALLLAEVLTDLIRGFSRSEIHLLCYAGCLLWLYEGRPYADWDYAFISSSSGLPYAKDIDEALDVAQSFGFVEESEGLFILSANGRAELDVHRSFEGNKVRKPYLHGAADSLLILTPGNIREAIEYDPNLTYLKNRQQSEWLLREPDRDRIYSNFVELRRLLTGESVDLAVPLITWLKYLLQLGRHDRIIATS